MFWRKASSKLMPAFYISWHTSHPSCPITFTPNFELSGSKWSKSLKKPRSSRYSDTIVSSTGKKGMDKGPINSNIFPVPGERSSSVSDNASISFPSLQPWHKSFSWITHHSQISPEERFVRRNLNVKEIESSPRWQFLSLMPCNWPRAGRELSHFPKIHLISASISTYLHNKWTMQKVS